MTGLISSFAACALSAALFSYCFPKWIVPLYGLSLVLLTASVWALTFFASKRRNKNKPAVRSVISSAVFIAVFAVITYIVNNIILKERRAELTAVILSSAALVFFSAVFLTGIRSAKKIFPAVLCIIPAAAVAVAPLIPGLVNDSKKKNVIPAAVPAGLSLYTESETMLADNADFYVSLNGSDDADGSFESPFATIEKARDAVRSLDRNGRNGITVAVMAGDYRVKNLTFSEEDGGTENCPVKYCAYGDGEVTLNGGLTILPENFARVADEEVLSRLSENAKADVLCADLKALGLTSDDWGRIYAIGSYNTAAKYDGDYVGGQYCELFVNDKRMTLARYPDSGWLVTDNVVETGFGRETDGSTTFNKDYESTSNPKGDTYKLSKKLSARVASWKTLDDVWMFGFFKYSWADASTLIEKFDPETGYLTTKFVSVYGTSDTAPYYFFNVLEELDSPGEWYLDRENGILYLYPDADMNTAVVDLSVTEQPVITVCADYLTFSGFTIKGTRSDAVVISGNNDTVENCLLKNTGGSAISMTGYGNLAYGNEITRTGKGGIYISGGDTETLTPGNSKADNNLIHDWSEIYQTYQPAVALSGVGNICSHNEMFNSPHEAVTYSGNNHIIEYNNIHEVCLLSDDAGAIYSGRRWDWYGNIIRYNAISNIYGDGHRACGIYLDDALSGQTVYGNILVNVGSIGLHLGGGRDLTVKNNLIVNCFETSVSYDDRAREGAINNGWFNHSSMKDGNMWTLLYDSPWQSEIWQKAYPQYEHYSSDANDADNPDFVPNPSYSDVSLNIIVNAFGTIGNISDSAYRFSSVTDNFVYNTKDMKNLFKDAENGDYTLIEAPEGFEQLPFGEIGRY